MTTDRLRLVHGDPEIPTAAEIAALTWDSGDWRSSDGLTLIPFLIDRLGPEGARALLNQADDYLAHRRAL